MVGLHAIITKETLLVTYTGYTCTMHSMHALDAECQGKKESPNYVCRVDWMGGKGQPDQ